EIAVFWAAQPHGLVDSRTGDMCWLHVPFSMFLAWGLPEAQTAPLLSAQPLITHAPDLAARIAHTAERWRQEIDGSGPIGPGGDVGPGGGVVVGGDSTAGDGASDADGLEIALLEIQAAVRRVLRASSRANP